MFSQELINRIKTYFQERHGVAFSDEQAIDALNSLADLYLLFVDDQGSLGFPPFLGGKPSDLISPHSC
jgi:hypothetical protein